MRERLLNVITHPAFISLLIWIAIVPFLPPLFSKYIIKEKETRNLKNQIYYFADLDNDGESEEILIDLADQKQSKVIVSTKNKIIEQFNIRDHFPANTPFYVGDYNSDGFAKCFIFTMSADSIFLTVIDPMQSRNFLVRERFVDFRRLPAHSSEAPNIFPVMLVKDSAAEVRDFIFYIRTGFSKQPRRVYRYLVDKDSLIRSPLSGACITECLVADINNDQSPELIISNQATGNIDFEIPYTDYNVWLMVLNKNLDFLFDPVPIRGKYPASLYVVPLKHGEDKFLAAFHDYYGTDSVSSAFYLFDNRGIKLSEVPVTGHKHGGSVIFPNERDNYSTFFFLRNRDGEVEEKDTYFNTVKRQKISSLIMATPVAYIDADNDSRKEYIFQGSDINSVVIVRDDFSGSVSHRLNKEFIPVSVSQVIHKGEKPVLYLQSGDEGYFLEYSENGLYYLKYPFYVLLYITVYLFILMIFRLQRYRLEAKEKMEKQMALLQMRAIKNQMDPHFTLNVLNSIGSLYASDKNREQADYIFGKYARLIRETVISSGQVVISLEDEIDFVRNYIDLERFRCGDAFSYSIDIEPGVDLHRRIPRMMIHMFVENAIKHGLKCSGGKGMLRISLQKGSDKYIIEIEDNNSGSYGGRGEQGTGRGLHIVKELTELYFRLEKVKIRYSLKDRLTSGGKPAGKIARIIIPV